MKKLLAKMSFCGLLLFLFLLALRTNEPLNANTEDSANIHGLISVVEYNNNRIYLFGSMQFGRANWFPLNEVVEYAMSSSDKFLFEFDFSLVEIPEYAALISGALIFDDDTTLEEYLPPDVFEMFKNTLSSYSTEYDYVSMVRPMWVSSILNVIELGPILGLYPNNVIDIYIFEYATQNNKPVSGLIEFEREMYFMRASSEVQIDGIKYHFLDFDTSLQALQELILAYESQDADTIFEVINAITAYDDAYARYFTDILQTQRSIEFADKIETLLRETDEPTTFFATISIGHMVGDTYGNVLNILKDRGFQITN